MNEVYELKFSNGFILKNITMNGNNYVSKTEVKESDLVNGLSKITVKDNSGNETVLNNTELVQIIKYEDGWYFILRELTEEEIKARNTETELTNLQIALAEVYEMILE